MKLTPFISYGMLIGFLAAIFLKVGWLNPTDRAINMAFFGGCFGAGVFYIRKCIR